jgi:hypothetical protein
VASGCLDGVGHTRPARLCQGKPTVTSGSPDNRSGWPRSLGQPSLASVVFASAMQCPRNVSRHLA